MIIAVLFPHKEKIPCYNSNQNCCSKSVVYLEAPLYNNNKVAV